MSLASHTRREPPRDVWIGLDPAPAPDMTAIVVLTIDREQDAAEETLIAEARRTVLLAIAGLLTGLALAALVDWIIAGPGLRVMVGL